MTNEGKRYLLQCTSAIGLSVVLSMIDVLSLIYMIPALVVSSMYHDEKRFVPVGAAGALAVLVSILQSRNALSSTEGRIAILVSVFIPLVLWASSLVFAATDGKRTMERYVASVLPGCIASIAIVVYLSGASDAVLTLDKMMSEQFGALFKELDQVLGVSAGTEEQVNAIYRMAVMVMGSMMVPLCMGLCGLNLWFSLSFVRKDKITFSMHIASWRLKEDTVWAFLILWILTVGSSLLKAPYLVVALVMNLACGISVLYGIQGFAILLFRMRKRNADYTAGRLFTFLLIVFCMLPGLNALVVVVLPLLGVTETWIQYRKNE